MLPFSCVCCILAPTFFFYGRHLSVYSCIYWVIHSVQMGTLQRNGAILEQNLSPTPLPPGHRGSHHLPHHSCDVYLRCVQVRESTEVNVCPTIPVLCSGVREACIIHPAIPVMCIGGGRGRKHRGSHDPPSHSCAVLRCKRAQGLALSSQPFL